MKFATDKRQGIGTANQAQPNVNADNNPAPQTINPLATMTGKKIEQNKSAEIVDMNDPNQAKKQGGVEEIELFDSENEDFDPHKNYSIKSKIWTSVVTMTKISQKPLKFY